MVYPKRADTLVQALDVVLRQIADVPDGVEAEELRESALDLQRALEGQSEPPSAHTRNALQKRVLSLHLAARKLGRSESR